MRITLFLYPLFFLLITWQSLYALVMVPDHIHPLVSRAQDSSSSDENKSSPQITQFQMGTAYSFAHLMGGYGHIPPHLLHAISLVESGISNGKTTSPWPWTINVEGKGYTFKSKQEAIHAVQHFRNLGRESIDVGLMQINLKHHPHAFQSLEQAFDPTTNIAYAARFLTELFFKHRSWHEAVKHYHSGNPILGSGYLERVLKACSKVKGGGFSSSLTSPPYSLPMNISQPHQQIPQAPQMIEAKIETANEKEMPVSVRIAPLGIPHDQGKKGVSAIQDPGDQEVGPAPGAIQATGRIFPIAVNHQRAASNPQPKKRVKTPSRATQKVRVIPLAASTINGVMPLN